jgi:phosphoglycolate phosphatase-like HAD superfamily hydrolase
MVDKKEIVIFDIDGTLADHSHRLHYIENKKKDWDNFYEACDKDTPIQPTIDINLMFYQAGYEIILLTGRRESTRNKTIEWCHQHGIKFDMLLMRRNHDYRQDTIFKKESVEKHVKELDLIHSIFEDRKKVVNMWRDLGIQCYHVTEGDY